MISPDLLLAKLPRNRRTGKVCREYLQKNVWNISEFPRRQKIKIITEEIAKEIIQEDFSLIRHIPASLRRKLLPWTFQMRNKCRYFDIKIFLEFCPAYFYDSSFCKELISAFPLPEVISYIPARYLTHKFWKTAIYHNPRLIKVCPKNILPGSLESRLQTFIVKSSK